MMKISPSVGIDAVQIIVGLMEQAENAHELHLGPNVVSEMRDVYERFVKDNTVEIDSENP